jgi:adhesin/invasin
MTATGGRARTLAAVVAVIVCSASPAGFTDELPDFMRKWEFGLNVEEDDGPDYFADLILPVYRHPSGERVVFAEPRVRYADGDYLFNLGAGVRQLVDRRRWLLGANLFYDYETDWSHYRLGAGLEALSSYAEARFNTYWGLSGERLVEEAAAFQITEDPVNGFDVELGMPVPYYSRVKLFYGLFLYDHRNSDDRTGWRLRTEYKPAPFLVIDGLMSNDTKSNVDWGMTVSLRIPLGPNAPDAVRSPLALDETAFPDSDVTERLWDLVERHHEIVVERIRKGGLDIEVARGT